MGVEHSISKRLILTFEEKERVTGYSHRLSGRSDCSADRCL